MNRELKKVISSFVKKQWLLFLSSFLLVFVVSYVNVLVPLSIGKFFETQYQEHSAKSQLIDLFTLGLSDSIDFVSLFAFLVVIRVLFGILSDFISTYVGELLVSEVKRVLFTSQLRMKMSRFDRIHMTTHLQRYSGEMVFIQRWISKGLIQGAGDVLFVSIVLAVLMFISWKLMLLVLITFSCAALLISFLSKNLESKLVLKNADRHSLQKYVSDQLSRLRWIKLFQAERSAMKGFDDLTQTSLMSSVVYSRFNAVLKGASPFVFYCILFLALFFLGQNQLKADMVLSIILLILYTQGALKRILRIPSLWQQAKVAITSIDRIYQSPRERRKEVVALDQVIHSISFEKFALSNSEGRLFKAFSLDLKRGEQCVFVVKDGKTNKSFEDFFSGFQLKFEGKCTANQTDLSLLTSSQMRGLVHFVNKDWIKNYREIVLETSLGGLSPNAAENIDDLTDLERLKRAVAMNRELKKPIVVVDLFDLHNRVEIISDLQDSNADLLSQFIFVYITKSEITIQNLKSICLED